MKGFEIKIFERNFEKHDEYKLKQMSGVRFMIINYLNYCAVPKYSEIFEKNVTDEEFVALLSSIPCGKAKEVIILSVSIEKVQPIGELLAPIDKSLAEEMSVAKVTAYHNVNIEEFEIICDLLESKTMELSSILTDWYQCQRKDKLSAVLLRNYLHENKISYNSSKRVLQIFDEVNKNRIKELLMKKCQIDSCEVKVYEKMLQVF